MNTGDCEAKKFTLVFKTAFLLKLVLKQICYREPVAGASQDWTGSTTLLVSIFITGILHCIKSSQIMYHINECFSSPPGSVAELVFDWLRAVEISSLTRSLAQTFFAKLHSGLCI